MTNFLKNMYTIINEHTLYLQQFIFIFIFPVQLIWYTDDFIFHELIDYSVVIVVCEYYAHEDCQDFCVSDCKECATYGPHKVWITLNLGLTLTILVTYMFIVNLNMILGYAYVGQDCFSSINLFIMSNITKRNVWSFVWHFLSVWVKNYLIQNTSLLIEQYEQFLFHSIRHCWCSIPRSFSIGMH